MIRSLIQIEDGPVNDFYDKFGFKYMDADERTDSDEKEDAVSSYAEEAGEHRDGRTVGAPFDYIAKFLVEAPNKNLTNVNAKIAAFNAAVREKLPGSDIKRKKEITFYNLLNHVKIVGYPEVIAVPTEVYNSGRADIADFAQFELKIRVSDPSKCDFNIDAHSSPQPSPSPSPGNPLTVTLAGRGEDVAVTLSRPLEENEHVTLLRRGSAHKPTANIAGYTNHNILHVKRKYRWQVYARYYNDEHKYGVWWPFSIGDDGILRHYDLGNKVWQYNVDLERPWETGIKKSSGSKEYRCIKNGITFGVAVYRTTNATGTRYERVSNVAYFKSVLQDNKTVVTT